MSSEEADPQVNGRFMNLRTLPVIPVLMLIQVACRLFLQSLFDAVLHTLFFSLFAIPGYFVGGLRTFNEAAEWYRANPKVGLSVLPPMIFATIMFVAIQPLPSAAASLIAAYFFYHGFLAGGWWLWSLVRSGRVIGVIVGLLVVALFIVSGLVSFTNARAFEGFEEVKAGK